MQSKSRRWMTPLIIVASAAVFAASAFAASGNLSAYNTFKQSMINTMSSGSLAAEPENYTLNTTMNVNYDGETVIKARNVAKNQNIDARSYTTTMEGADFNNTTGSWVWKEGDTEYILQQNPNGDFTRSTFNEKEWAKKNNEDYYEDDFQYSYDINEAAPNNTEIQFVNALIDTVMGDTKNYFTTDGDYIVLNLEGGQIPELVQLGTSLAFESMDPSSMSHHSALENGYGQLSSLEKTLTSLKNHRIDALSVRMLANDSEYSWMTDTTFSVKLSGQDANGIRHSLAVDGSMNIEQVGSTVADPAPDLTGKTVRDVDLADSISIAVEEATAGIGMGRVNSYSITTTDGE